MKSSYFLFIILITGCTQSGQLESEDANDTTSFVTNDTIPLIRNEINKKPVASYMIPVASRSTVTNLA